MKKSTLISGIVTLNILGLIVAVTYQNVLDVLLYGLNIIGVMIYYVETSR